MRILIEGYPYDAADVKDVLRGLDFLENVNHKVVVNYVGYMYNPHIQDCVFILPKVLIDKEGKAFSRLDPAKIICVDKAELLEDVERKFIYEFAVWIYRALYVFNKYNPANDIIYYKQMAQVGAHHRHITNTYLEVLLALVEFNKKNQNFFMTILKNIHSGVNKINWTRTIAHSQAIVQDNAPIYLNPINKKRQINFDEELLIIFFSILRYINEKYGFPVSITLGFELITGAKFENYLNGYGQARLRQIKYKYFSDKALYLWELCYAFFDKSHNISVASDLQEYLIAKNFNIVFEAIIDELVGDKKENLPDGLKEQEDGKRVDHLYSYKGLTTNNADDKSIYYIGDSKYYQLRNEISKESVYKQYTYARNVIQWNMNLFLDPEPKDEKWRQCTPKYRDEVTEGYNIVPNFFISARMDEELSYADNIHTTDRKDATFMSKHFENRLFDRDTLLIYHYDVNFLYVVSLYAQDNYAAKQEWKDKVRKLFRKEIQQMLGEQYHYYVMTPHAGVNASAYIEEHFQQLLGKVFTPYENNGTQRYYSLALSTNEEFQDENDAIISQLETSFHVRECKIGDDPRVVLADVPQESPTAVQPTPNFLTLHYLEKYEDKSILVGYYRDEKHLQWILGNNDRGTQLYNVRLGKNVRGGFIKAQLDKMVVSFVILYEYGHADENKYRVFRVHHHATMTAERLKRTHYPSEPTAEKYLCYVFDEEVTLGHIDIARLIKEETDKDIPIFKTGKELLPYRKA